MSDAEFLSPKPAPVPASRCPYLGLLGDSETSFGFPDQGNRCHRLTPVADISLDYQQNWCLSPQYTGCRIFQNPSKYNLPEGITLHITGFKLSQTALLAMILIATLLALAAAFFLVQSVFFPNLRVEIGPATLTAAAASISGLGTEIIPTRLPRSVTPSPSTTPTLTLFPSPTQTPLPSLTFTPEPLTPGPGLETPFGPGSEFVLHQVQPGESARSIAYEYRTSYTVITTTNELLPGGSILVDSVLVIVPGMKENLGMPIFRTLYLDQDGSVREIAELYAILPDDVRRYNSLGLDDRIPAGRWIIIPLPTPTNP